MKKIILALILLDLVLLSFYIFDFSKNKSRYLSNNVLALQDKVDLNRYYQSISFKYVQNTNKKIISNKKDLLNVIYTMINNDLESYDIKCDDNYINNLSLDLISIINGNELNILNSLAHPYNSINNLKITTLSNGNLRLISSKKYTSEQINFMNRNINNILSLLISDNQNKNEQIKKVHDYLANYLTYNDSLSYSDAYSALLNKQAICTSYSELLAIFLTKLDIPNYRVVSNNHMWNVIYYNNKYLHIDLTLDDEISIYNTYITNYNYYLIDSNEIRNKDIYNHNFDLNIYLELS